MKGTLILWRVHETHSTFIQHIQTRTSPITNIFLTVSMCTCAVFLSSFYKAIITWTLSLDQTPCEQINAVIEQHLQKHRVGAVQCLC